MENLDDYKCSICFKFFIEPKRLKNCFHTFCRKCILGVIDSQKSNNNTISKYSCPICRNNFIESDIFDCFDLAKIIETKKIKCDCGKEFNLNDYNIHFDNCQQVKQIQNQNINNINVPKPKNINNNLSVNRETFNCSLCDMKNFDREGLIRHISDNHRNSMGVCPICLCQPWGDPNYITQLYGHLMKRHKFDYNTLVDYNDNEDAILQKVLQESLNDM